MRCYSCNSDNTKDAKFCSTCGTKLAPTIDSSKKKFESNYTKNPTSKPEPKKQVIVEEPESPYQAPKAPVKDVKPAYIPTYLVQSILVTIFCCMPFGIAAIVFAAQVESKRANGDIEGALSSSSKAKTFCWVAFLLGLLVVVFQFLSIFLTATSSTSAHISY